MRGAAIRTKKLARDMLLYWKRVDREQVKVKLSRSIKLMRGAAIRTKKLARDMLLYWKRVDREQINVQCSDRSFAYQMVEELHNPWAKKQFLGFARTSEFNGPRMPCGPHYLIKEKDTTNASANLQDFWFFSICAKL
ncbi:DNA helicase INO80-like [Iris pallida]|uniref:DNA helicase INO80-like n=1 Tax=Iris pallida TaxID=29817 RepID=A0AAX6FZG1_IRIPA|nr:DNA helicase INO80-like [Iris pallida]